ncbi:DciA family protein [Alsobacter sp. KACC 23698]|uniref:DciA family protein n=1 Tax=Alsobacter sp. KACC 23698 TaxID=3149229 RepID=A0AAU7JHH1_9HYPH
MKKKPALRTLADLVDDCIAPALAAQGFAASDVVVAWPEIVGERLAPYCEPVKIQWPRRPKGMGPDEPSDPAILVVRVEGAFALELQHLAPLIVERVNTRYGWRCVGRLSFRQGPVGRDRPAKPAVRLPDAPTIEEARRRVGELADEGLREALVRLGAGVMARRDG